MSAAVANDGFIKEEPIAVNANSVKEEATVKKSQQKQRKRNKKKSNKQRQLEEAERKLVSVHIFFFASHDTKPNESMYRKQNKLNKNNSMT